MREHLLAQLGVLEEEPVERAQRYEEESPQVTSGDLTSNQNAAVKTGSLGKNLIGFSKQKQVTCQGSDL